MTNDWMKQYEEQREREEREANERIELAKPPLFTLLFAANVTTVQIDFSGGGDEGDISDITFFDAAGQEMEAPNGSIMTYPGNEPSDITEYVKSLAWDALDLTNLDWVNNEGGQGTIVFDMAEETIKVDIGINEIRTEDHEYEF